MALVTSLATSGILKAVARQAATKFLNQYGDQVTPDNIRTLLKKMFPGKKNSKLRSQVRQKVAPKDRVIDAPRARNIMIARTPPKFQSTSGTYSVTNREFIGTIKANNAGAYVVNQFTINPGFASTFPWLSTISNTHQKYKFKSLRFEYVPLVGTQTNGRIALAYSIDPHERVPQNKVELFQYPNTTEGCVWDRLSVNIKTNDRPVLFVRSGGVADADVNTYDFGNLFVATTNANVTTVGDLYVEYEAELITPKPFVATAGRLVGKIGDKLSTTYCPVVGEFPIFGTSVFIAKTSTSSIDYQFRFSAPGAFYITLCANFSGTTDLLLELNTSDPDCPAILLCRATSTQAYNSLYLVTPNTANVYLTTVWSGAGTMNSSVAVNATITVAAASDNQTNAENFISSS